MIEYQITILDLCLEQDPNSRCIVETTDGHGKVFIIDEVTTEIKLSDEDIKRIVKQISNIDDVIIHLDTQLTRDDSRS